MVKMFGLMPVKRTGPSALKWEGLV